MEAAVRRVRVVCVARRAIKAQFVMTVSSSFKARPLAARAARLASQQCPREAKAELLPGCAAGGGRAGQDPEDLLAVVAAVQHPAHLVRRPSAAAVLPPPFSLFSFAARG